MKKWMEITNLVLHTHISFINNAFPMCYDSTLNLTIFRSCDSEKLTLTKIID